MPDHHAIERRASLREEVARLLVKVRYALRVAFVAHIAAPLKICFAISGAAFTTKNDPVYAGQVKVVEWSKGRFITDESNGGRNVSEFIDTPSVIDVLYTDAEPYVGVSVAPITWKIGCNAICSLGQQLPVQPRGLANQGPQLGSFSFDDMMIFHVITHRRTEHAMNLAFLQSNVIPFKRFLPSLLAECTAVLSGPPNVPTITPTQCVGVAIFASRGNFLASPSDIESVVGPSDNGLYRHAVTPHKWWCVPQTTNSRSLSATFMNYKKSRNLCQVKVLSG